MSTLRRTSLLSALAAVACLGAGAGTAAAGPVTPVPSLDAQRYVGEWRQIAAKPQWFEALCLSDVFANYALNADGTIAVRNRCLGPFGLKVAVRGNARVLDQTTGAQLQVTFAPAWGGGWSYNGSKPNYIVMGLGEAYDWAVVGDPDRTSAFVLARDPSLSTAQLTVVRTVLQENGFDPCRLRVTPQRGGLRQAASFCTVAPAA